MGEQGSLHNRKCWHMQPILLPSPVNFSVGCSAQTWLNVFRGGTLPFFLSAILSFPLASETHILPCPSKTTFFPHRHFTTMSSFAPAPHEPPLPACPSWFPLSKQFNLSSKSPTIYMPNCSSKFAGVDFNTWNGAWPSARWIADTIFLSFLPLLPKRRVLSSLNPCAQCPGCTEGRASLPLSFTELWWGFWCQCGYRKGFPGTILQECVLCNHLHAVTKGEVLVQLIHS